MPLKIRVIQIMTGSIAMKNMIVPYYYIPILALL